MRCPLLPGPDERLDVLSNTLHILQRRKGHRATSDDLWLAWAGAEAQPTALRVLDLGTGKGTVALLLCRRLPQARIVGVEAFPQSHALAVRNAALNHVEDRYSPRLGDLRDEAVLADEARFDLVCGAPPFMPVGSGVLPQDPQRAAGRFELRGGVEAYAVTAARHLTVEGRVVLLMDGRSRARAEAAVDAAGLHLYSVLAVCPRPWAPPTYQICVAGNAPGEFTAETVHIRPAEGEGWSEAYLAVRAALDLPG